jgi:hypothetical protein
MIMTFINKHIQFLNHKDSTVIKINTPVLLKYERNTLR